MRIHHSVHLGEPKLSSQSGAPLPRSALAAGAQIMKDRNTTNGSTRGFGHDLRAWLNRANPPCWKIAFNTQLPVVDDID